MPTTAKKKASHNKASKKKPIMVEELYGVRYVNCVNCYREIASPIDPDDEDWEEPFCEQCLKNMMNDDMDWG